VAFSSPEILGGLARQAGISCGTCHVNGSSNPRLYVPGLSTVPGNFDTTNHLFNAQADNGVLDPVTVPSLRGAHLLAPYGHDGRTLSLRDFVRNVIVNEFAGPEPSARILDAIVLYIEDIDFVPNPRLAPGGALSGPVSEAEKRGAALFRRPFPHDPSLSCAGCHQPEGAFVDHRQHDVGSNGLFKTPTLLNANFNAPYFHDGRYANYAQVVAHFDRVFYLGLSVRDRQDLVAFLEAIGDGEQAVVTDSVAAHVKELREFATVLDTALSQHDVAVVTLTVDTLDLELRDLTEAFPGTPGSDRAGRRAGAVRRPICPQGSGAEPAADRCGHAQFPLRGRHGLAGQLPQHADGGGTGAAGSEPLVAVRSLHARQPFCRCAQVIPCGHRSGTRAPAAPRSGLTLPTQQPAAARAALDFF
jgi:hypothetical protein